MSLILLASCIQVDNKFNKLAPGPWRAVLKLPLENVPSNLSAVEIKEFESRKDYEELPFNMNVRYINQDSFVIDIINGDEIITSSNIKYGLDRATAKDTVIIDFPAYDTYIDAIFEENFLEGRWHVNYKEKYSIPFIAYHGQLDRFPKTKNEKPVNVDGSWMTTFEYNTDDAYPAIAELKQKGNKLEGTFKTETGDYRFLEGIVDGEKFYLSCFDGSHAFLFTGKMTGDNELVGKFRSGKHYTSDWKARKATSNDTLENPYFLSKAMTTESIDFTFIDEKGNPYSLNNKSNNGKVKLVNIMGTWCPNCRDEAEFLKEAYKKLPKDKVEIISIAFERYKDETKCLEAISRYKTHMGIPWTMLYGGYANKKEAGEKLPFIDKVISYPTLLFVDKQNTIQKIHTGFYGPATEEFKTFDTEFFDLVNTLIQSSEEAKNK